MKNEPEFIIELRKELGEGKYDDRHWEIAEDYSLISNYYAYSLNKADFSISYNGDQGEPLSEIQAMYLTIFQEYLL